MVLYRKFSGNDEKYFTLKECVKGQVLVDGRYIRTRVNRTYGTPEHEFFCNVLDKIVVIGSGHLGYLVKAHLQPQDPCRVIYNGMKPVEDRKSKFFGKPAHSFEIEIPDPYAADAPVRAPNVPGSEAQDVFDEDEKAPWDKTSDDDMRV